MIRPILSVACSAAIFGICWPATRANSAATKKALIRIRIGIANSPRVSTGMASAKKTTGEFPRLATKPTGSASALHAVDRLERQQERLRALAAIALGAYGFVKL